MNPHHYAVVVGITQYPGGFRQLAGPVNDAEAFYQWLIDPAQGGVPEDNAKLVITPGDRPVMTLADASPSKEAVDDALWEVTERARTAMAAVPEEEQAAARECSRLYLYGAGHGIMPGTGEAALLTAKAATGRLDNVELRAYRDWYALDGTFAEVCIFADCCRTFQLLATPGVPNFNRPGEIGGTVFSLIGYATAPGKLAFEDTDESVPPDNRRGYFSRALIDGLRGAATDPDSGYVTSWTLANHVSRLVPQLTDGLPKHLSQTVSMPVEPHHLLFFGPRRARTGTGTTPGKAPQCQPGMASATLPATEVFHKVVIHFPANFSAPVELEVPDGQRMYWQPTDGPWTINLREGVYVIFRAGTNYDAAGLANGGAFEVAGRPSGVKARHFDVRL